MALLLHHDALAMHQCANDGGTGRRRHSNRLAQNGCTINLGSKPSVKSSLLRQAECQVGLYFAVAREFYTNKAIFGTIYLWVSLKFEVFFRMTILIFPSKLTWENIQGRFLSEASMVAYGSVPCGDAKLSTVWFSRKPSFSHQSFKIVTLCWSQIRKRESTKL